MASDYIKPDSNLDDIFIRNVYVGIQQFFHNKLKHVQVEGDKKVTYDVPFYASMTGDEQFLMDYYFKVTDKCKEIEVKSTTVPVPSGIFNLRDLTISSQDLMNKFERALYTRKIENEYGEEVRMFSARTSMIPVLLSFNAKVKSSSENMKFRLWQNIVRTLYKVRKFYITFEGYSRIPCLITLPENYTMEKEFQFTTPDSNNKRPMIEFGFEVLTYLPDPDLDTEFATDNKIDKGMMIRFNMDNISSEIVNPVVDIPNQRIEDN